VALQPKKESIADVGNLGQMCYKFIRFCDGACLQTYSKRLRLFFHLAGLCTVCLKQ